MDTSPDLSEVLAPGVATDDIPELATLLAARPVIDTFISLFRGTEAEVLLRLLVLREIGQEADTPRWSPETLRSRFSYLDSVKLETVLKRLRDHSLLTFGEDGLYHLSDVGRNAVAALSMLLSFSAEEDVELGFLTAQLAGLSATGSLTPEALSHLLSKLNDLTWHFEEAIASGSEFHILHARSRLKANGRWLDRGTEILHQLLADPEVDFDIARIAQRIGLAQSRLARVDAAFQRALNKIETQRVTLGGSGISSSDVTAWLRAQPATTLASLLADALDFTPSPPFLAGGHELLDRAETVLSDETRADELDTLLPAPDMAPVSMTPEHEDLRLLEHFTQRLITLERPTPLHHLVTGGGFAQASYRLSLLTLLAGDTSLSTGPGLSAPVADPVSTFMALPFSVTFSDTLVTVNTDEIAAMTEGLITPYATSADRHTTYPIEISADE